MNITETLSALSRLSLIVHGLCHAIGFHTFPRYTAWGNVKPIPGPIALGAWTRLRRAEVAIKALMEQWRAGLLRPVTRRAPSAKPRPPNARARTAPARQSLPRGFAWLCALLPGEAAVRGNHLRLLLAEPEMLGLLAATPRAARILKPICRMLGVAPDILTPAPAPPPPAPSAQTTPVAPPPVPHPPNPAAPPPGPADPPAIDPRSASPPR